MIPTPEEHFGINAGKVYWALNEEQPLTVNQLSRETKLRKDEIDGALGWLAREGKVIITSDKPLKFTRL